MQWQLGREMGTIPAFASRTQENQENLCRDGRSQNKEAHSEVTKPVLLENIIRVIILQTCSF